MLGISFLDEFSKSPDELAYAAGTVEYEYDFEFVTAHSGCEFLAGESRLDACGNRLDGLVA